MLAEERKKRICEIVNKRKTVRVSDLSKELDTTEATVRRDLDELQKEKKLRRIHGGAMALYSAGQKYIIRELEADNIEAKRKIARKAYEYIDDNDTIIFDGSSTVLELSRLIAEGDKKGIILLTNALSVVNVMAKKDDITVIHIGGEVRYYLDSTVGKFAEKFVSGVRVDKTFLGVNGVDIDFGFSITNFDEAAVKKEMIRSAKQKFILTDHTKFGSSYLAKIAELEGEIDFLITDEKVEDFDYDLLEDKIQLVFADKE